MKKFWFFLMAVLLVCLSAKAQEKPDSLKKRTTFFPLPLIYYTPETRWAFGGAAFLSWRFKSESDNSRPSQIQLGGAYTLNDQILTYSSYQLWWGEEKYTIFGELGWYRYNYYYFGIGNKNPVDLEELYGVNYPRVRATFLREIFPNIYAGVRFTADDFKITELNPEGALETQNINGSNGGLNSGAGMAFTYDTRDNYFESHKGWYAEVHIGELGAYLGSDFDYTHFQLDVRRFFTISENNFLGLNFYSEAIYGEAPFISLALLGGNKRMRGFYEGRYRDNNSAIFQAEYRRDIVGRLGAVVFGGVGAVADGYKNMELTNLRGTYGAGLRMALNKEDRINIRFDVGIGNGEAAYYLTIGEAF
ncbi:BamA/TamA family outer membrane protein [Cryomorpha ignava]|uniref:BamA/TamA family outer membrane protein n=1 Tax=Cryomorpha ignava TaxID=101383 RepID=A0A7K3WL72_9FLAO|nr:BamA/TamA family outer membrane protein [Cryomorpha ignava]NEN22278.1 BamA/TamA family outer membrane protein [Cryomorpha ignava]